MHAQDRGDSRRFAFLLLSFIAAAASGRAAAQAAVDPLLETVTVSAGRGTTLEDMDVSTTVIPREAIRQAPQTQVEQIVSRIPGVFALQRPAGQLHPTAQVFSIRGFGTTTNVNTLLMVDGVPVNDPFFRTIDWGQIPKDTIERIEVIRGGGATSLWGNLAMGGIVNIVTRDPVPGERRVSASYGSNASTTLDLAGTLLANDRLKVGVNLGLAGTDGYMQVPAEYRNPYMTRTESRADNLLLTTILTPSAASRYYLKAQAHRSKEEGLVWAPTRNEWDSYRLVAGGSTRFASGASVNLAGWLSRGTMATKNAGQSPSYSNLAPQLAVPFVSQVEAAKYRSAGASAFWQRDLGAIADLKVGADFRLVKAVDRIELFSPVARTAAIAARGEHRFQGLFAQGTWRPASIPLDVTLGLRQDFWQAVGASVTGDIFATGSVLSNPVDDASYSRFNPRLGARYFVTPEIDLRAAVYRNFAAPGMNQMYRSFVTGTSYTATSPDLRPQTNTGREIGIGFRRPGIEVSFTLFDNELRNFIDFVPLCTTAAACDPLIAGTGLAAGSITRVNRYVNAGTAVFRGAELIGSFEATPSLRLRGGLTRTIAHLKSSDFTTPESNPPAPVDRQIGQVPKWMLTLGGSWDATPRLSLAADLKVFPDYWNNTAHTQRNDGAALLDVGAIWRWRPGMEFWASIQNLTDRGYHDQGVTTTTIDGSTVSPSSIPALGMPRTITVGFRAEF